MHSAISTPVAQMWHRFGVESVLGSQVGVGLLAAGVLTGIVQDPLLPEN